MKFVYCRKRDFDMGLKVEAIDGGFTLLPLIPPEQKTVYGRPDVEGATVDPALSGRQVIALDRLTITDAVLTAGPWELQQDHCCVTSVLYLDGRNPCWSPLYNRYAETENTRRGARRSTSYGHEVVSYYPNLEPFKLAIPFRKNGFSEATLLLDIGKTMPLILPDGIEAVEMEPRQALWEALPIFKMIGPSSVKSGEWGTVTINMTDYTGALWAEEAEVWLEPVSGLLPLTRVQVVAGVGTFPIGALGLKAGDTLRVKAGFRCFGGLSDLEMAVV